MRVRAVATYSAVNVLHEAHGVRLVLYRCPGHDGPAAEEVVEGDQFCFVRSGSFVRRSPRGKVAADANQVLFFHHGDPYRVHHPHPGGDECLVLSVPEEDRRAWMQWWGGADARHVLDSALTAGGTALSLHRLVADLRQGRDAAEVHERCLDLLAGIRPLPGSRAPRRPPLRDAPEVAQTIKVMLMRRLAEPLRLAEIAAAFGMSPFTLCRLFHRQAGLPVHRYRVRLRLRHALDRLAGGERDLTSLALDLGFSDHSHFTNAFRAEFGVPPSAFRAAVAAD
jgi:AraC-like DNA-binding protein